MIISRSFSRLILSRSTPSLICSLAAAAAFSSALSTEVREGSLESKPDRWEAVDEYKIQISKKAKSPSAPSKLAEIPWQVKVANAVQLIGKVGVPVRLVEGKDGSDVSVTLLLQDKSVDDPPQLWIPLVFQGDLAEVAGYHLKKNDTVYVTGQLSSDAVSSLEFGDKQSNLQVIVQSLSFVRELLSKKSELVKGVKPGEKQMVDPGLVHDVSPKEKSLLGVEAKFKKSGKPSDCLWEDLVANPKQWLDCRMSKQSGSVNSKYPDFKCKNTGESLWVGSAPYSVLKKLNNLTFTMLEENTKDVPSFKSEKANFKKSGKPSDSLWEDLVANPKQWLDCRMLKQSGSVNSKYPDFRHKNTGEGLWVGSAPHSVSKKLNNLTFTMLEENTKDVSSFKSEKAKFKKSGKPSDCLWEDLVANPKQWLDCRMSKQSGSVNPKYPDFRHKNTGEGLWVGSAPYSVSKKLSNLTFTMLEENVKGVRSWSSSKSEKDVKSSECPSENRKFPRHNRKAKLERNFQNLKENEFQEGMLDFGTPDVAPSKPPSPDSKEEDGSPEKVCVI